MAFSRCPRRRSAGILEISQAPLKARAPSPSRTRDIIMEKCATKAECPSCSKDDRLDECLCDKRCGECDQINACGACGYEELEDLREKWNEACDEAAELRVELKRLRAASASGAAPPPSAKKAKKAEEKTARQEQAEALRRRCRGAWLLCHTTSKREGDEAWAMLACDDLTDAELAFARDLPGVRDRENLDDAQSAIWTDLLAKIEAEESDDYRSEWLVGRRVALCLFMFSKA